MAAVVFVRRGVEHFRVLLSLDNQVTRQPSFGPRQSVVDENVSPGHLALEFYDAGRPRRHYDALDVRYGWAGHRPKLVGLVVEDNLLCGALVQLQLPEWKLGYRATGRTSGRCQRLREDSSHSQQPGKPTRLCSFPAKSPAVAVAGMLPDGRSIRLQFEDRSFAIEFGWSERVRQMGVEHASSL